MCVEAHLYIERRSFKSHKMGFRLLLLAAMGLGAMYMMHLLAQDWNKIRQPVKQAAKLLSSASAMLQKQRNKRELFSDLSWVRSTITPVGIQPADIPSTGGARPAHARLSIDWKSILSRDPFECLQSLICQVMSGAESQTQEAILLMDFIEATLELAPAKIGRAFSRGLALRGSSERCFDEYPFCLYSAKTMLRILRWFSAANSQQIEDDEQQLTIS